MKRLGRWLGRGLLILVAVLLVGPLLIPMSVVDGGTLDIRDLTAADSRFVNVLGYDLHYKEMGQGERVLILMNGFGGNLTTWRKVMAPLAEYGRVIAFDRIGTGLSDYPMFGEWTGKSPYANSMQPEFVVGLMDALQIEQAILVGNSQGGTIAVQTALAYPERVQALILADPGIYTTGGFPPSLSWLYATPQMRRLGPLASRQFLGEANADELVKLAWHDPSKLTAPERAEAAQYGRLRNRFRALWEYTVAGEALDLASQVGRISMPTLIIAGDDDRIIPTEEHARLAKEIPNADYFLIAQCGHVPQEEQPEEFLRAVDQFLNNLK